MPRLTPFAALRFTAAAGDPADLIAPPYDVIDASMADRLRSRSPHNAVRLILPEGSDEGKYAVAAALLSEWVAGGVIRSDERPCVYAYRQRYDDLGSVTERLALFAALDLEPFGDGVLPHERTHAGPKRDRLALTLATAAQLSPIFFLARDPEGTFLEALRAVVSGPATVEATTPDGIEHSLWVVEEEGAAAVLCALAGRNSLLVADGHHRYETALEAQRQLGPGPADRLLACVVSTEDPGLTIRATHRTLRDLGDLAPEDLVSRLAAWFEVEPLGKLKPAGAEAAAREAAADPAGMIVVVGTEDPVMFRLSPRDRATADAPEGTERRIAAVRFDRFVLRTLLGTDADEAAHEGKLEYHRKAGEAIERAGARGAAFLLPPVRLDALWSATAEGERLPPKSTYFEPKIPSGLLFRSLRGE